MIPWPFGVLQLKVKGVTPAVTVRRILPLIESQSVGLTVVAVASGAGFTETVLVAVAVQPAALVTVTVYVVIPAGLTLIAEVVSPVLQAYQVPPVPVSVTLCPAQTVAGEGEIPAVGRNNGVSETQVLLEQPLFVTVTQ